MPNYSKIIKVFYNTTEKVVILAKKNMPKVIKKVKDVVRNTLKTIEKPKGGARNKPKTIEKPKGGARNKPKTIEKPKGGVGKWDKVIKWAKFVDKNLGVSDYYELGSTIANSGKKELLENDISPMGYVKTVGGNIITFAEIGGTVGGGYGIVGGIVLGAAKGLYDVANVGIKESERSGKETDDKLRKFYVNKEKRKANTTSTIHSTNASPGNNTVSSNKKAQVNSGYRIGIHSKSKEGLLTSEYIDKNNTTKAKDTVMNKEEIDKMNKPLSESTLYGGSTDKMNQEINCYDLIIRSIESQNSQSEKQLNILQQIYERVNTLANIAENQTRGVMA